MSAPSAAKKSLNLPAPDFTFDENDENLELFTIRLPVKVPLSALNDLVLDMKDESTTATFTANGQDYRIQMGDPIENESFRVLVPILKGDDDDEDEEKDSDDEEEDGDDENEKSKGLHYLQPSSQAFSKHFNVFASVPHLSETQLAPRDGPPATGKMRHAYAPIAQRSGLKRRWMPLGVPKPTKARSSTKKEKKETFKSEESSPVDVETEDAPLPPTKRIKTEESDKSSSKADKKAEKAEKKAKKAEKKSAKKAKKDAKKSKKVKKEES
jgi:hypothetical protein